MPGRLLSVLQSTAERQMTSYKDVSSFEVVLSTTTTVVIATAAFLEHWSGSEGSREEAKDSIITGTIYIHLQAMTSAVNHPTDAPSNSLSQELRPVSPSDKRLDRAEILPGGQIRLWRRRRGPGGPCESHRCLSWGRPRVSGSRLTTADCISQQPLHGSLVLSHTQSHNIEKNKNWYWYGKTGAVRLMEDKLLDMENQKC